MSYRPPSHPPTTTWAKHLDRAMQERGWSQTKLFEEIGPLLGYGTKSRAALLPYIQDKPLRPGWAEKLLPLFGEPPKPSPGPSPATPTREEPAPDLAAAVAGLTRELAAMRRERRAWQEGWVAILRAYGEGQVPTELLDALVPPPLEDARP